MLNLLNEMINQHHISLESKLLFIDDGSVDNTWDIIKELSTTHASIIGIKLSRNFGHQNALLSGLLTNIDKYNLFLTLDVDLQDDIKIIPKMIDAYTRGNEIVYGVRSSREEDSFFKRKSAQLFYTLQKALGINIVENHADFRLISNKVLHHLNQFEEINLFLRAIFPLIGFKTEKIYYKRLHRNAGETKYTLLKMLKFALDGITSFTTRPLHFIFLIGLLILCFSFAISIWIFIGALFTNNTIPGWASTTLPIYFLGGVQLFSIGVLGEYIGKIYTETKSRPRYIIEEEL